MTFGKGLADGQAVPYGRNVALLFNLQHGHLAGHGVLENLFAGGGMFGSAQADIHDLERCPSDLQRHERPKAPARPVAGADDQGIAGHVRVLI